MLPAEPIQALVELGERYLAAVRAGDRHEAVRLVLEDGIERGVAATDIHLQVVAPAQREIGRLWQENLITIADEHQATAISQLVLARVFPFFERSSALGQRVLLGCVEGELHDMAARMAADVLDAEGFDVRFLGANVPTKDLLTKVEALEPDVVALSVTMTFHLGAAAEAAESIRRARPDLPIVVGGHAVIATPDAWVSRLAVTVSQGTALDLAAQIRRVLRENTP